MSSFGCLKPRVNRKRKTKTQPWLGFFMGLICATMRVMNHNCSHISSINTHNGKAHLDEFLACCIAICFLPSTPITRHLEIPDSLLDDPTALVLDKGRRFEPALLNFDHHQDGKLECAFNLWMAHLGYRDALYDAFAWGPNITRNDTGGMKSVAEAFELPTDQKTINKLEAIFSNPVAGWVLDQFSSVDVVPVASQLYDVMQSIGGYILEGCERVEAQHKIYDEHVVIRDICGFPVADMTTIKGDYEFAFGSWLSKNNKVVKIVFANDARSPGCTRMVRRDEGIDFRKYARMHPLMVRFCHESGFLLTMGETEMRKNMKEIVYRATDK